MEFPLPPPLSAEASVAPFHCLIFDFSCREPNIGVGWTLFVLGGEEGEGGICCSMEETLFFPPQYIFFLEIPLGGHHQERTFFLLMVPRDVIFIPIINLSVLPPPPLTRANQEREEERVQKNPSLLHQGNGLKDKKKSYD